MNEGWWKRREQPGPPPLIHIHFFIKSNFQFEFDWKKLNGMAWLAHRPSIKLIPSILINGRAAQGRSKLHFFSSPIRKNELKRNECFADGRLQRNQTVPFLQLLISLSFHYHSMKFHQLLKYFHCLIPLITVIILSFINSIKINLMKSNSRKKIKFF